MHGQPSPSYVHPATRLRQLGLHARKRLSQSFLADPGIARAIVAGARLDPSRDEVLEVGPGLGILTEHLVRHARRVVAVELDAKLAEWLPGAVNAPNLEVHQANILRFDPSAVFDEPYVVVANLPYHVTSPALSHLLAAGPPFAKRFVLMVQREVAERVAASPGHLSALAVSIQAQAKVRIIRHVSAGAFHPPPRVDSGVLLLEPLPDAQRIVPRHAQAAFTEFVHSGFAQPRKQLANSLAQGLAADKATVEALLASQGIDPRRRPQELSVTEWGQLFRALTPS